MGSYIFYVISVFSGILLWQSCATSSSSGILWPREQRLYRWQDHMGTSYWRREVGQDQQGHLTSKLLLYTPDLGPQRPVEKAVIFSEVGQIKNRLSLRPWRAQYRVWLEGQEYFAEQQLDSARRKMMLTLRSPHAAWNGTQEVDFPVGKVFCYVGQLTECLRGQGFLLSAIKHRAGRLNFHLIWEGYPFVQEQYAVPNQLFTPAIIEYDGELGPGLTRFSVSFADQVFFLVVNERGQLEKFFWVAQGITAEALDRLDQAAMAQQQALINPSPSTSLSSPSPTVGNLPITSSSSPSSSDMSNGQSSYVRSSSPTPAMRKMRWVGNPAEGNLSPSGR